jgi:hypothetical protein
MRESSQHSGEIHIFSTFDFVIIRSHGQLRTKLQGFFPAQSLLKRL